MTFESREEAGRKLGLRLQERAGAVDLVLGLPRGGVVVAAEVARVLQRPLQVLVVRKIGHPFHREFAVGAMAENEVVLLDELVIGTNPVVREGLEEVIRDEAARLKEYERKFGRGSKPMLTDKGVLLVDDGLATGATMEAAVVSARKQGARAIIVAVPVASTNALQRLERVADEVVALIVDPDFDAVGRYYDVFSQTTDEEVVTLLSGGQCPPRIDLRSGI
jgi:putative phosphoribosyl transferase